MLDGFPTDLLDFGASGIRPQQGVINHVSKVHVVPRLGSAGSSAKLLESGCLGRRSAKFYDNTSAWRSWTKIQVNIHPYTKYTRIERERRFLVGEFPAGSVTRNASHS
jgi:hypothetical protein